MIAIKLKDADDVEEFLDIVSQFVEDVNLHIDHQVVDAKSLIILMNAIDLRRNMKVEIVTNSNIVKGLFAEKMKRFE